MSIYEVANYLGTSAKHLRKNIGAFGLNTGRAEDLSLSKHALAAYLKDAMLYDDEHIASILGTSEEKVKDVLDDKRERYDYSRYYCWWERKENGWINSEFLAEACGLDPELVKRAASLGLLADDESEPRSGYSIEAASALRVMGIIDAHPIPWVDGGGEDGQDSI